VKFEDNAAVITDDNGEPAELRSRPVAREVAERFGKIASVAQMIV